MISSPLLLVFACGVLVLLALLPMRYTRWVSAFRGPLMVVVAPVANPLSGVQRWLRGSGRTGDAGSDTPRVRELRQQTNDFRTLYFKTLKENEQLRALIEALQSGMAATGTGRTKLLDARSFGFNPRAGTIEISRGTIHGVTVGTVATAISSPQHLVGVVTSVSPTTSTIRLITDARLSPGLIEALIITDAPVESGAVGLAPRAQFHPTGDGTLLADLGIDEAQRVSKGDLAFVDDSHWPPGAQRLILGRVQEVRSAPDQPLFQLVVIRPDIDVARVAGVLLRIPAEDIADSADTQNGIGGEK